MPDLLSKYEAWFRGRHILSSNGPKPAPRKFDRSGNIKPFYGLTCIAWINQESELFQELCNLQDTIRRDLREARSGDVFAFLRPESFHMTICDVVASSNPIQSEHACVLIEQVRAAFEQIGKPGKVTSQIKGIGLTSTITALVRFSSELELKKVLAMEGEIKWAVRQSPNFRDLEGHISFRPFAGHISLAYCVQDPGDEKAAKIKDTLFPHRDKDSGAFRFSQFDLTCFTDMNTYIPLLTINLDEGKVTNHHRIGECQTHEVTP